MAVVSYLFLFCFVNIFNIWWFACRTSTEDSYGFTRSSSAEHL